MGYHGTHRSPPYKKICRSMSRAKKIFRYGLITLLVIVVVAYFVGNHFLNSMSREAMRTISQRGRQHGVEISAPQFAKAAIAGIRTARWTDLSAELRFPESKDFDGKRHFELRMEQLDVWLAGGGQVILTVDNLNIDSRIPTRNHAAQQNQTEQPEASINSNELAGNLDELAGAEQQQIHVAHLECTLDWQLFDPSASLEQSLPKIVELVTSGTARLPMKAEGTLQFDLKNQPVILRLKVQETPEDYALALEAADVEKLSERFAEKLTTAEVTLVATNPLRAPKLLRIKDDAESTAESTHAKDPTVPQDAYRHILWSYLLTKQFGKEFAEQVTVAHEQGDTGNTPSERDMDLHNNRIGRQYADAGLQRTQILQKLSEDKDVILSADQ